MDQVELYSKNNQYAQSDNRFVLEKYGKLLTWKIGESILDIGVGVGKTTKHILFPHIPQDFKELIGCDISESMVEFARKEFEHPKVKFVQLDIATEHLPSELENRFDHVFSFYCFHWIQNSKQALKNVYDMLKPGGEIFISFMERNPFDQPYENLSKYPKWKKYGHENFISPFHHSLNSYKKWKEVLEGTGFEDTQCMLEKRCFEYSSEEAFKDLWDSVNPIISKVPEEDLEEYHQNHMHEMQTCEGNFIIQESQNNEKTFRTDFNIMIMFGRKAVH